MKAQELPIRVLLISFVIVIIALIILIAFSKQGIFQFSTAWKSIVNPIGIR